MSSFNFCKRSSFSCIKPVLRSKNRKAFSLYLLLFLALLGNVKLYAQEYFQQQVNYVIQVTLNDVKNELTATEKITYTNHSTQELNEIYFHLWPNGYKNDSSSLAKQMLENRETSFYYSKPEERGYIDGLSFKVDGVPALFTIDSTHIDIGKLQLKTPLKSGQTITIYTPFHVKIPSAEFSRLGHLGDSYMISQWFPKPAVYDATGWHAMPYLSLGEFYSEFGDFDISITLPKNYVVGATGYLQDSSEIKWLEEKAKETLSIEKFDKNDLSFPNSDSSMKTIRYLASNVHDFAWFADKRFHVLKNEIKLPLSKRTVTSWALFTNAQASFWKKSPDYMKEAILNYSNWLGEYPYNQVSIVDGSIAAGTGMEYPMITVIGNELSLYNFEYTVVHELGHNWFYGILASNERDYAWMDEGINTYYNLRFFESKYPSKSFAEAYVGNRFVKLAKLQNYSHKTQYALEYFYNARRNLDQSCNTPSVELTELNYAANVYSKTGFVFHYLECYLGQNKFDSIMKNYYENWKFKHPQPQALRNCFESYTGKNLAWFFDDLIGSTKKMDYKISKIHANDSLLSVKIKNRTGLVVPFSISAINKKEIIETKWFEGFNKTRVVTFPKAKYSHLVIDYLWDSPEINRKNNLIRSHGWAKKIKPIGFQFIGSIENNRKAIVNYFPAIGYNSYDKTMLGLALYNISFIQKPFEYLVLPFYATGSKEINGAIQLNYHWNPNGIFQAIEPQVALKKYSYRGYPLNLGFIRIAPAVDLTFRKKVPRSSLNQKIRIASTTIFQDASNYSFSKQEYEKKKYAITYTLNQVTYFFKNTRTLNPFGFNVQVEQGKDYVKSSLEAIFNISYKRKNKSASIRVFGGKMLYSSSPSSEFGFAMSGNNDYAFENIYVGRNDVSGIFNQQFYMKDGGFKNLTLTTNSLDWLLATNIIVPAPGKIPLAFYADLGKATTSEKVDYNWGVAAILVKDIFEIYVPVKQSSDLNQLKFTEKIRFVLHFNAMNPFQQIKSTFN